jgi:hypothetical protein
MIYILKFGIVYTLKLKKIGPCLVEGPRTKQPICWEAVKLGSVMTSTMH